MITESLFAVFSAYMGLIHLLIYLFLAVVSLPRLKTDAYRYCLTLSMGKLCETLVPIMLTAA